MKFINWVISLFSKKKDKVHEELPEVEPRENRHGQQLPDEPIPATGKLILPDFRGASKLRYPHAARFIQDPDVGGKITPKFVVLHHTVSKDLDGTVNYFKKNIVDIHYLLGQDGTVIQMAENDRNCAHAGTSEYKGVRSLNGHSIGIEVINMGPLYPFNGKFLDYYNNKARKEGKKFSYWSGAVRERKGLGYSYWEPATEAAEGSLIDLCWYLHSVVGIPVDSFIAHYECSPGRKNDPYGLLSYGPMNEFRKHLKEVFANADKAI